MGFYKRGILAVQIGGGIRVVVVLKYFIPIMFGRTESFNGRIESDHLVSEHVTG